MGVSAPLVLAQTQAQTQRGQQAQPAATTAPKAPYVVPKTPWGEPDLQGMWPLNHLIATNLQRNPQYGTRRFLTDEEFAAAQRNAAQSSERFQGCLLYTSDAADERSSVDLGGRR